MLKSPSKSSSGHLLTIEILHSHATSTEFGAMPGIMPAVSGGGAVLKVFWIRQTGKTWNQKSSYILTHLRVNHWMNLDEIDYIGICSKSSMKLLLPTMLSDFVADEIVHGNLFGANA